MGNKNELVALAYIKVNNNPLEVFCNYILYVLLSAPDNKLRVDEIHSKVLSKFGLNMPQQMIKVCIRILKKNYDIKCLDAGAGCQATNTTFNIAEFDKNFLRLQEQENSVIQGLAQYVNLNFKQDWSLENAKNYLSVFLDKQENAATLFLNEKLTETSTLSPSWYISRYVQFLAETKDSLQWQYLVEIVNGLMIYQGIYQTNDYEQDRSQKFKGTCFYFDTKLILRALGYSWGFQVQAARELMQLITKEYGGKVCVFEQTINEVSNALEVAGKAYKKGNVIPNKELQTYATLNPTAASLLVEKSAVVRAEIINNPLLNIADACDWYSKSNQRFNIDVSNLIEHIKSEHQGWRTGTIDNDVDVINQINILRRNNYTQRYGGKNKLPVFVTTNIDLVYSVKTYAQKQVDLGNAIPWNPHALPIVSDNMILFRLWVPVANKYTALPALTLSRYAYNSQNADQKFFETLRKAANEYGELNGIDLINLSDARRQKLEDIVVAETKGDPDNITDPVLATSVEELIKLETAELNEQLETTKKGSIEKDSAIEEQKNRIIELAAKPYYNKVGILRFLIYSAKNWWMIVAIVVIISTLFMQPKIGEPCFLVNMFLILGPPISNFLLFMLGKFSSKEDVEFFLLKPVMKYSVRRFSLKIRNNIEENELEFADEIIEKCLRNTKVFSQHERFWY